MAGSPGKFATTAHRCRSEKDRCPTRCTIFVRRPEGDSPARSNARSIGKRPQRSARHAASGRRSMGACGAEDGCSTACRGGSDAPSDGDDACPRKRAQQPLWWSWLRCARGLIFGVACAAWADGRSRLSAHQMAASPTSTACRTLREMEISIAAGIAPGGGCGGQWRRSARSLSCPVFRQPCCRPTGRYQSTPPSPRRSIRGAFDAPRGGDAERAADRPRRRSW